MNNIYLSGRFCIHANLTKELFSVLLIIVKLPILDKRLTAPGKNSTGRESARHFVQKWQNDYRIPESPAAAYPLSFPIFGRTTKHISASCCTASPLFKAAGGSENGQPAQTTRNFRRTMCFKQRKKEGGILTWVKANTL